MKTINNIIVQVQFAAKKPIRLEHFIMLKACRLSNYRPTAPPLLSGRHATECS
jgi:hypothetical protein